MVSHYNTHLAPLGTFDTLGLHVDGNDRGVLLKESVYDVIGLIDGITPQYILDTEDNEGDKIGTIISLGSYDILGFDVGVGVGVGVNAVILFKIIPVIRLATDMVRYLNAHLALKMLVVIILTP